MLAPPTLAPHLKYGTCAHTHTHTSLNKTKWCQGHHIGLYHIGLYQLKLNNKGDYFLNNIIHIEYITEVDVASRSEKWSQYKVHVHLLVYIYIHIYIYIHTHTHTHTHYNLLLSFYVHFPAANSIIIKYCTAAEMPWPIYLVLQMSHYCGLIAFSMKMKLRSKNDY